MTQAYSEEKKSEFSQQELSLWPPAGRLLARILYPWAIGDSWKKRIKLGPCDKKSCTRLGLAWNVDEWHMGSDRNVMVYFKPMSYDFWFTCNAPDQWWARVGTHVGHLCSSPPLGILPVCTWKANKSKMLGFHPFLLVHPYLPPSGLSTRLINKIDLRVRVCKFSVKAQTPILLTDSVFLHTQMFTFICCNSY